MDFVDIVGHFVAVHAVDCIAAVDHMVVVRIDRTVERIVVVVVVAVVVAVPYTVA